MEMMRNWWATKTEFERGVFVALGIAFCAIVFWAGVLAPLQAMRDSAEDRYQRSAASLSFVREAALTLRSERTGNAPQEVDPIASLPLRQAVPNAASAVGMSIIRLQPEGDHQLTLWVEDADARRVYAFIDRMERAGRAEILRAQLAQTEGNRVRGNIVLRRAVP